MGGWETCASGRGVGAQSSLIVLAVLLAGFGCGARPEASHDKEITNASASATSAARTQRVRAPAVAGLFYPGDAAALSKTVDGLLARAPEHYIPRLKALVCPHAGYEFSGQTAAIAYKLLAGRDVQTVVVMGPSHYACFQGACIPNADAYKTPLGLVPISEKAKGLASVAPFVLEPQCLVQRPAVVAAGAEAGAGGRPGHARDMGAFGRGAGALLAEGAEELQTPAGGDWRGGPGAGGQGAGRED